MAREMGVKIAMGTDTGVGPHGSNAEELELMVQNGMTSMEAIVATTRTAAECARIDRLTGTLEPTSGQLRTPLSGRVPPTDVDRLVMQRYNHPTPPRRVSVGRETVPAGPSAGFTVE